VNQSKPCLVNPSAIGKAWDFKPCLGFLRQALCAIDEVADAVYDTHHSVSHRSKAGNPASAYPIKDQKQALSKVSLKERKNVAPEPIHHGAGLFLDTSPVLLPRSGKEIRGNTDCADNENDWSKSNKRCSGRGDRRTCPSNKRGDDVDCDNRSKCGECRADTYEDWLKGFKVLDNEA
jgi:hypothetical protein